MVMRFTPFLLAMPVEGFGLSIWPPKLEWKVDLNLFLLTKSLRINVIDLMTSLGVADDSRLDGSLVRVAAPTLSNDGELDFCSFVSVILSIGLSAFVFMADLRDKFDQKCRLLVWL